LLNALTEIFDNKKVDVIIIDRNFFIIFFNFFIVKNFFKFCKCFFNEKYFFLCKIIRFNNKLKNMENNFQIPTPPNNNVFQEISQNNFQNTSQNILKYPENFDELDLK